MKRRDLEKHLREHGCERHHHGGRHDAEINAKTLRQVSVPRHNELKRGTVRAICEKLEVPSPD
ncbi:MAG: type II toxin-antitoxin system HicA family toxin [Gammaproteobacteria bacterium]|nr:type II toxin-antitoxin system HicA family toxin [Gammaproteobacteria bacterium]